MTPPADLAALRALVEAVQCHAVMSHPAGTIASPVVCLSCNALPAAREALERVEDRLLALHVDPTGHLHRCARVNGQWLCAPDCPGKAAQARLTRLEEALRDTLEIVRCQAPDIYEALDVARAALEGRDE